MRHSALQRGGGDGTKPFRGEEGDGTKLFRGEEGDGTTPFRVEGVGLSPSEWGGGWD